MKSTGDINRSTIGYKEGKKLFYMALPFTGFIFAFSYLPLYGWLYAFFDYSLGKSLKDCEFVGLYFFKMMFSDPIASETVLRVLENTLAISFLNIIATVIVPLFFAIFLNEISNTHLKKKIQTSTTLPNFLSWPLVYVFAFAMFSTQTGLVNHILLALNVVDAPIQILASPKHVWLTQTGYTLWKSLGWSSIMYLAAMASIDDELYEAARIDGAGRFKLIRYITIPMLIPTFFVLLLLAIANILNNGIDQYFVFQNAMSKDKIEVLDLYVYNIGLKNGMFGFNYSFATAVGILKSLISLILLFGANFASKKIRGQSII